MSIALSTHHHADLQLVYLHAVSQPGRRTSPGEVTDAFPSINNRYARELLTLLVDHGLMEISDEVETGDDWMVIEQPDADYDGAFDNVFEAIAPIVTTSTPPDSDSDPDSTPAPATRKISSNDPLPNCLCGCGIMVNSRKTWYRPGHDARHASQVGKAMAALLDEGRRSEANELLKQLQHSTRLQDKAKSIASNNRSKVKVAPQVPPAPQSATPPSPTPPSPAPAPASPSPTPPAPEPTPEPVIVNDPEPHIEALAAESEIGNTQNPVEYTGEWIDDEPIKIGRWEYPTRRWATSPEGGPDDGRIQFNDKRDGSGEWKDHRPSRHIKKG